LDGVLYVDRLSRAKLARRVPEEVGKAFNRSDIKAALDYSFERSADEVHAYLEENFKLVTLASDSVDPPTAEADAISSDQPSFAQDSPAKEPLESWDHPDAQIKEVPENESPKPVEPQTELPDHASNKDRKPPRPARPSLMERFAGAEGFRKDSEGRFFHPDGSWIAKTSGMRFPWERRTKSGEIARYYWPDDRCLENATLELDADVWALIRKFPETYALILTDARDEPVEVTGILLMDWLESGKLKLYPASYRLAMESEDQVGAPAIALRPITSKCQ
jgi:hypothetical protein